MEIKLRHIGLVVNDFEKMMQFYSQFGFKEIKHLNEDVDFYKFIYQDSNLCDFETYKMINEDGIILELLRYKDFKSENNKFYWNFGLTHMAFTVKDINKLYNDLKSEGIKFLSSPLINPEKTVKLCFCKDPEDNLLELVQELKV